MGSDCIDQFPNVGLADEAKRRAAMIDVIWIKSNVPLYAFEVDATTSIYSGLLRMSDLLALLPALNVRLFLVAPEARKQKVFDELARPTFDKIGLREYCRFVSIERLATLVEHVEQLRGHVRPTVVDTIADELPEEE